MTGKHGRAAVYMRVSNEEQIAGHSLDAQRTACVAFAETRGWRVVEVYADPGRSAKTDDRPEFKRMIADAQARRFDVIVTHKLDRFSRSILDVLTYLRRLNECGVAYVSVSEQFDFTTPIGKVLLALLAAFAEWYLDNLSAETAKGKAERARQGLWNGHAPFGYCRVADGVAGDGQMRHRLEAHPENAAGVQLAFRLYASGNYSDGQVARELNARGYATANVKGGGTFGKCAVRELLQNRFYLGEVRYRGGNWSPGQHPALVDAETFEQAQAARRKARRRHDNAPAGSRIYPLSGIAYCAECLSTYRGQHTRSGRHYRDSAKERARDCGQRLQIKAADAEGQVAALLRHIRLPDDWRRHVAGQIDAGPSADDVARRRTLLAGRMERVEQMYVMGHWEQAKYLQERARVLAELDDLREPAGLDLERVAAMLADFGAVWDAATDEQRKRLLRPLLDGAYFREKRLVAIVPTRPLFMLFACRGPDPRQAPRRKGAGGKCLRPLFHFPQRGRSTALSPGVIEATRAPAARASQNGWAGRQPSS